MVMHTKEDNNQEIGMVIKESKKNKWNPNFKLPQETDYPLWLRNKNLSN